VAFGGRDVLTGIDLAVAEGEIVALIGHNGAGKTTLLRSVMGLLPHSGGRVIVMGAPVRFGSAVAVARSGLAFVPQRRNVFHDLTVGENLALARDAAGAGAAPLEVVHALFPILADRTRSLASQLSGGQQQMLALAIALLRRPKLILLDEPSTGLSPLLTEHVFHAVVTMRRETGTAFLIVDQNVNALLGLSSRAYVLKSGRLVFRGPAQDLAGSQTLWTMF
jgi:branched-chain amino acid transport system ATP-binding protein